MKAQGFKKGIEALENYDIEFLKGFVDAIQIHMQCNGGELVRPKKIDIESLNQLYDIRYTDKYARSIQFLTNKQ